MTERTPPREPGGRVVAAFDGSPGGRAAVVWALAAAARAGTGLEVVVVLPVEDSWGDAELLDPGRVDLVRSDVAVHVRELLDEYRGDGPDAARVRVTTTVVPGRPADELVRRSADAGLLVVGSRGRGTTRSVLLGSVALSCVPRAPCPVVVVHPSVPNPGRPRVVVGLDDTDEAREVLWRAAAEAHRMEAGLDVVVAVRAPEPWSDLSTAAPTFGRRTIADATSRAEALVREELGARPDVWVAVEPGPPAEVLVRHAQGAALLVVGSHSRGRLSGMLLGSTALHCVVAAPCPVLVLHPEPVPADVPTV
ncbi:universal stress protein [Geodermatophilus aquaeductus]|uniref:Nucleotide-binding universal stress protein, UspA family n=1 Tax=Geodermatophilus aquaeductus TaxID=1564161 RepID=A0A521EBM1_9ACTN|nr:universal stress protein [Geodermatophilus aquaeductus]SMO81202.1 Nucleotide-binding universal stress protein, UspA family [Geodermatophilus aquaeductus]